MQSFLHQILEELWEENESFDHLVFILPGKRAGTFLKNGISKIVGETIFAPETYSIESFIEMISGLSYATNTQQLFELYNAYLNTGNEKKEDFKTYSNKLSTVNTDTEKALEKFLISKGFTKNKTKTKEDIDNYR